MKIMATNLAEKLKVAEEKLSMHSPKSYVFDLYGVDLPISGGWGYSVADACVILGDCSPGIDDEFFGIELEYKFIELRTKCELALCGADGVDFEYVEYEMLVQSLQSNDDRHFDKLHFIVEVRHEVCGQAQSHSAMEFDLGSAIGPYNKSSARLMPLTH